MNETKWKVGQEVYIVPFDKRGRPRSARIVSIARKWMKVDPEYCGPISKEDGCVKPQAGHSPTAKAWTSKDSYEDHVRVREKWNKIRLSLPYAKPEHLAESDLDLISKLIEGETQ